MVTLCESGSELSFLPADPYAARITALMKTYGTTYDFAMFWVQSVDGIPVAAISKTDGNMTVCCCENADYEELSYFINAVGYSSLTCDEKVMIKLGIEPSKTSFTVRYNGGTKSETEEILRDCDKKEIYNLLVSCGFELGDYNTFLADVCARLNKQTASFAAAEVDKEISACAFALFEGEKSVLLGAVATKESARGKGLASKLVGTLAEEKSDKEVYLFCRNDGLVDFYRKIGFVPVGKWAISEK